MNRLMQNTFCRILIALMVWAPFQMAHAGMIGTEQFVSSADSADRTTVLNVLSRSDVVSQLQSLGIDPAQARNRVQAMSDQEIAALANRLESLPAGASNTGAVVLVIIIVAAVWWYMTQR
ncbi:MAG TPA: PA2779 family protein [Burkholderiales bacterium]|nr:PA2779 family protein [Burkholderiales bacterium]